MEIDPLVISSLSLAAISVFLVVFFLTHPEKVEIWSALIAKALSRIKVWFRGAHKHYVKHELQGRVNEFTSKVSKQAPYLGATKCRVEWETGDTDKKAFLEGDEVIIRLRREDPDDMNFVHGAYHFVSTALLHKVKRYVSPSHRESIDLFVTTAMLQAEKPSLVSHFLDEYLHPATADADSKVVRFFDQYSHIDKGGLFYTVLLQELDFLGDKVFGGRKDDTIIIEVNDLVSFLEGFAGRSIGEEMEMKFDRSYCRFALVIVGKSFNVAEGARVFVNYINRDLAPKDIETVYVLGSAANEPVLNEVCEQLASIYEVFRGHHYKAVLNRPDGTEFESKQALYILRKRGVRVFQPSR